MLSQRGAALGTSKTTASRVRAENLKASGLSIANLAAGELDLLPPPGLTDLLAKTAGEDVHRYTPTAGTPRVRAQIANYVTRSREILVAPENVIMIEVIPTGMVSRTLAT